MTKMGNSVESDGGVLAVMSGLSQRFGWNGTASCAHDLGRDLLVPPPPPRKVRVRG